MFQRKEAAPAVYSDHGLSKNNQNKAAKEELILLIIPALRKYQQLDFFHLEGGQKTNLNVRSEQVFEVTDLLSVLNDHLRICWNFFFMFYILNKINIH